MTYSRSFVRVLYFIIALEAILLLLNYFVLGEAAVQLQWCMSHGRLGG